MKPTTTIRSTRAVRVRKISGAVIVTGALLALSLLLIPRSPHEIEKEHPKSVNPAALNRANSPSPEH